MPRPKLVAHPGFVCLFDCLFVCLMANPGEAGGGIALGVTPVFVGLACLPARLPACLPVVHFMPVIV